MAKSDPTKTPAMRQFTAFKEKHPECVLFFRMGDFYEMFFEDATLCHKVLGITLTERTKGVPMAGVPYHAVEGYLRKMVDMGYRVAVADQVQDPKEAKGLVDRAVTRVVTPGTLVDDDLLDDSQTNHVATVMFTGMGDDSPGCLAVAEISTGTFELFDALDADSLASQAARIGIDELLYVETATGEAPPRVTNLARTVDCKTLTGRPSWHFRDAEAFEILLRHFKVITLTGFGLSDDDPAIGAAGALLRYLLETQSTNETDSPTTRLAHIRPPHRRPINDHLILDAVSLRSLEVERTMQQGDVTGSLLGVMQHAVTPMGKRLLRQWLCFPLRDIDRIEQRQRVVGAYVDDRNLTDQFKDTISHVNDVARISARLAMRRSTPRDLVALGRSVTLIDDLINLLEARPAFASAREQFQSVYNRLAPLAKEIVETCVDHPPAHMREGGLIRDGVDAQLDEARLLQRDANNWLAQYQQTLIKETGIQSLKVGYNKVFGYYIEVTRLHSEKVPDTFSRKQTLKNAERYITPPLKEFETKVLHAEERAIQREQDLFANLCATAAECSDSLSIYADTIARLDVLACFADLAVRRGYTQPQLVPEPVLSIKAGRHPVLDEYLPDPFVPNDLILGHVQNDEDNNQATLALITGPNMAGKSTYIRQTALLTLLAHTGSYIPAESAIIGLTDRIFTRIGASDELHAGRSTFMVEMTETANILHHATPQSLVILDEIGRGTSTLDGLSLAWAVAEQLADITSRTLFATHYHELTAIADRLPAVKNLHVTIREWADEIIFVYRILPGPTDRSYGIHVAKIAGLPSMAVRRADELLENLEVQTGKLDTESIPDASESINTTPPGSQLALFTEYLPHPVVDELSRVDLDHVSPIEAMRILQSLQGKLRGDRNL